MFGKYMYIIISVIITLILMMSSSSTKIRENWGGIQLGRTANPGVMKNGNPVALGGTYFNPNTNEMYGNNKFIQVPKFDSLLAPRMSGGIDYGAYIRYDKPDNRNMAVPTDPLTFGNMATENYSNTADSNNCSTCRPVSNMTTVGGGYNLSNAIAAEGDGSTNNYNQLWNQLQNSGEMASNDLPVGTMTTMDASGQFEQPVVFDRIIYAPRIKSRLSGMGDLVRGDLAIVPCQSGWFSVYPDINTDLQEGYLGAVGGPNAVDKDLVNLIITSSGGAQTTVSGIDFANTNMAGTRQENLTAFTDVNVTSFP